MGIISAHDDWRSSVLSNIAMIQNAPIETLPFEIVSNIMLLTFAATPQSKQRSMVKSLCKVSSRWRQIAIQTPQLWVVPFPQMKNSVTKEVAHHANALFLQRSAPYPFPVSILNVLHAGDILAPLSAVRDAAHRWESLTVDSFFPEREAEFLAHIPEGKLDRLKKVDLRLSDQQLQRSAGFRVFESAPQLCEVDISMPHAEYIPPMPWSQLSRLYLACASPQTCLDALMQCQSIVTARVFTRQWVSEVAPSRVTTTLQHVKNLEIHMTVCSMGEDLGPFLRRLCLPALESLTLSMDYSGAGNDTSTSDLTPDLEFFLSHCSQKLEHLHLCETTFSEDMPAILAHTPCLTHLVFSDSETAVGDEFFVALSESDGHGHRLVPKLQSLELRELYFEFTELALWNMIKTRWCLEPCPELDRQKDFGPAQHLKRLELEWSDELVDPYNPDTTTQEKFTEEFRQALWSYRKQGLKFSGITTHTPESSRKERLISDLKMELYQRAFRLGISEWALPNHWYEYE